MPIGSLSHVVIVGGSLAGLRAAEGLRQAGFTGTVEIIGEEPGEPYDRTLLSKAYLAGTLAPAELALRQSKDLDVRWRTETRATRLDTDAQRIWTADETSVPYDGVVIATGAIPRTLPGLDTSVRGVHTLRTLADARALRAEIVPGRRLVIVGAGFIGTELASTARDAGVDTTVITPLPLLGTALGGLSAAMSERVRRYGVTLLDDSSVVGVHANDRVREVLLSDGTSRPADVVVVAVGAVPATEWLEGSGLKLDNGVLCDATMATVGVANAVAAGDVARWPHPALNGATIRLEHWTNTAEQAVAAGRRLADGTGPAFAPVPSFWSDQFGLKLQGVGFTGLADSVAVVEGSLDEQTWVAEYRRCDKVVAAVVAGRAKPLLAYRRQLAKITSYPGSG